MSERQVDEAREACDRGCALVAQGPPIHSYCIDAYARLAEVRLKLLSLGRASGSAATDAKKAAAACDVITAAARMFKVAKPMALLHRGMLHWISGRRAKANRAWSAGLSSARTMDLPVHEARLAYALGRTCRPSTKPDGELSRARDLFARLGIPEPSDYPAA